MRILFDMAGLDILHETIQTDFPSELCPVHMFALVPQKYSEILPVYEN